MQIFHSIWCLSLELSTIRTITLIWLKTFSLARESSKNGELYKDLVRNFYTGPNPLKQRAMLALHEEYIKHIKNESEPPKLGKTEFLAVSVPDYLRIGVFHGF